MRKYFSFLSVYNFFYLKKKKIKNVYHKKINIFPKNQTHFLICILQKAQKSD